MSNVSFVHIGANSIENLLYIFMRELHSLVHEVINRQYRAICDLISQVSVLGWKIYMFEVHKVNLDSNQENASSSIKILTGARDCRVYVIQATMWCHHITDLFMSAYK